MKETMLGVLIGLTALFVYFLCILKLNSTVEFDHHYRKCLETHIDNKESIDTAEITCNRIWK